MAPRNPHINIPRLVPRALSLSLSLSPSSVCERAAVSSPSSILSPSPAPPHSSPPEKSSPPCTARHSAESHLFPDPRELGRTNPPPTPAGRAGRATKLLRAYVAGFLSHRTSSSWTPRTTIIHGSTSPSPTTVSTPLDRPARTSLISFSPS